MFQGLSKLDRSKAKIVDSTEAIVVVDRRGRRLALHNTDQFRDGNIDFFKCLVCPSVQ